MIVYVTKTLLKYIITLIKNLQLAVYIIHVFLTSSQGCIMNKDVKVAKYSQV